MNWTQIHVNPKSFHSLAIITNSIAPFIMSSLPPSPSSVTSSHTFHYQPADLSADPTSDDLAIFTLPSPFIATSITPTLETPPPARVQDQRFSQYFYPPIPRTKSLDPCWLRVVRLNAIQQQRLSDLPIWIVR